MKKVFFIHFSKYLKNGGNYFDKKKKKKKKYINHGVLVYKKALMSEHLKNYIFRDINCFVKMSLGMITNFVYALTQKLV